MKKTIIIVFLLTSVITFAQQLVEVVYLKNGSIIRGTIVEQTIGESIKIQTADGSLFVYPVDEVIKIAKEPVASTSNNYSAGNNASQDKEQISPQPNLPEEPVDWRHQTVTKVYFRAGLSMNNQTDGNHSALTLLSYDLADDIRFIRPNNFTFSILVGLTSRGCRDAVTDSSTYKQVYEDNHGIILGIRPGYTIRFSQNLRLSFLAGGFVYTDIYGRARSTTGELNSIWRYDNHMPFDAGFSAGISLGITKNFEVYCEFRRGLIPSVMDSATTYARCLSVGIGF